jgi:hypothetical protein
VFGPSLYFLAIIAAQFSITLSVVIQLFVRFFFFLPLPAGVETGRQ